MTNLLPPGPRGRWRSTFRLIRDPRGAFAAWIKQYGDPFLLDALNGKVVVTGRADLIREIFGHEPDDYGLFAAETIRPLLGAGSIFLMEGDAHRRERKLLMPLFHGDRMKAYGTAIQQVARERARAQLNRPRCATVDLMTGISLEVIVRAIFGGDDSDSVAELFAASREMVRRSSSIIFFSKRLQFRCGGFSPWDRYLAARGRLFQLLNHVHQQGASSDPAAAERQDILTCLRRAALAEGRPAAGEGLNAELATLLFAGHETSAIGLSWAVYYVLRDQRILKTLQENIAETDGSPDALARQPYLKAVVQESLRIAPIVTEVLRLLRSPLQLQQYTIPAGYAVAPAAVVAHFNPETYPEPDLFRPERFLERSFSPFEYFPFGGGHRRCVGAAFATYEMAVVLGTLFGEFCWELLDSRPVLPRRRNVVMGPSSPIPVRIRPR